MKESPSLLKYLTAPVWGEGRFPTPAPLVGPEHFVGTAPEKRIFSFYGEAITLSPSVDWTHNPGTEHWAHDLNRFGFLVQFDPAQSRSVEAMAVLIQDWIAKNDRSKASPYTWGNLLNITIRMENWLRFVMQAAEADVLPWQDSDWQRFKLSVLDHVRVALGQLRARGFDDNWSLLALRALMFVLLSSETFPHRIALLNICESYAEAAVKRQVLPDGVQQELSPHYHWVALELIYSIVEMSAACGRPAKALSDVIAPMTGFLEALMTPSGRLVSLGDSDADYGPRIAEFLARVRSRSDAPPFDVRTFPYAGIVSVRDKEADSLLVFDAGPFGTGHQHEDKLSFWLSVGEDDIIVDPGRYLYETGDEAPYTYLRSTQAHSSITIDGRGQNARAFPEAWRARHPTALIEEKPTALELFGSYDQGYGPELIEVQHHRRICCEQGRRRWQIIDRIEGAGCHLVESRFQLHPCSVVLSEGAMEAHLGCGIVHLEFDSCIWGARVAIGESAPKAGWWSPGLNRIEPAPMLILRAVARLPLETRITVRWTSSLD